MILSAHTPLESLVHPLPTEWLVNYTRAFEAGRIQKRPEASFVNERGECCVVGGLAGAYSASDVVRSPVWAWFLGSELEEISRRFEAGILPGHLFYDEVVLELAARASGEYAETERILGRNELATSHVAPRSVLANRWPLDVPK